MKHPGPCTFCGNISEDPKDITVTDGVPHCTDVKSCEFDVKEQADNSE